jgi:hypothetical protein
VEGKMKATIIVCGTVTALSMATANAGQDWSASAMLPGCKTLIGEEFRRGGGRLGKVEFYEAGQCAGMLYVVGNTLNSGQCIDVPDGAYTVNQFARVMVRYIEARPQEMHRSFLALAWEALRDAWPNKIAPSCSAKKPAVE